VGIDMPDPGVWEIDSAAFVAIPCPEGRRGGQVLLGLFDRATGKSQASQTLPYDFQWRPRRDEQNSLDFQMVWRDGILLVTDARGLYAFTTPGPETTTAPALSDPPELAVHSVPRTVAPDADLTQWGAGAEAPLAGADGPTGKITLAHDEQNLYVGVCYPDKEFRPRKGAGDSGSGDWLEIVLRTSRYPSDGGELRFAGGADESGKMTWEAARERGLPAGVVGRARYDAAAGTLAYSVAIPLEALGRKADAKDQAWRRIALAVAAHDDSPGVTDAPRLVGWGKPFVGARNTPPDPARLYLHPLDQASELALAALGDAAPDLAEPWEVFADAWLLRDPVNADAATAALQQYIRRHPTGPCTLAALGVLDRRLRKSAGADPVEEALAFAKDAKVPDAIRAAYAQQGRAYISQWVYVEKADANSAAMLSLLDGPISYSRWVRFKLVDGWQELKLPLIQQDMQDTPLKSLFFGATGSTTVYWDRTTLVAGGKETILLDGVQPPGRTEGTWRWADKPAKLASNVHYGPPPPDNNPTSHRVWLTQAVTAHLAEPPAEPRLTQRVYLDPAGGAVKSVSLLLCAGRASQRVYWGEGVRPGRQLGPLPEAGKWVDLRVPLAMPELAGKPITGIHFEQSGGRVLWGPMTLTADGKDSPVIADATPAGTLLGRPWQWETVASVKAHTQDRPAGYHGVRDLPEPICRHVATDLGRLAAAMDKYLPAITADDYAWRLFRGLLPLRKLDDHGRFDAFVNLLATHPNLARNDEFIDALAGACRKIDPVGVYARVQDVIRKTGLTDDETKGVCQRSLHGWITDWMVLGPLPGVGKLTTVPANPPYPFAGGIDLAATLPAWTPDGVETKVGWDLLQSDRPMVDLGKFCNTEAGPVKAYAVCWVKSDKERPCVLEVGCDDFAGYWLNGRCLLNHQTARQPTPAQEKLDVSLPEGWSEIVVCVENIWQGWGFYAEFRDPTTDLPVDGLTFATTPPTGVKFAPAATAPAEKP
jgi:hypothetical protein